MFHGDVYIERGSVCIKYILYEQIYATKLGNLEEMVKCLETYKLPKLKQEENENLNRPIIST